MAFKKDSILKDEKRERKKKEVHLMAHRFAHGVRVAQHLHTLTKHGRIVEHMSVARENDENI